MHIRQIAICSEDPDQLCSFYEKTLGLRMVRRNPRGKKSSIYMTDGYMHLAINGNSDGKPNRIWHFGFLVPSLDPINTITPVHQGRPRRAAMRRTTSSILKATASMSSRHVADLGGEDLRETIRVRLEW